MYWFVNGNTNCKLVTGGFEHVNGLHETDGIKVMPMLNALKG